MVANGTAPVIPQCTEGSSFEPSVRKKTLQKVCIYIVNIYFKRLYLILTIDFRLIGLKEELKFIILSEG